MLHNTKRVFWEALFLTCVVFLFGLLLGVAYEGSRLEKVNEYYSKSEISLMDILAFGSVVEMQEADCGNLISSNIEFANRIYEEAILLEKYEDAGKITDDLKIAHKRYDLLRTFLWINVMKVKDKCGEPFSIVVYLYDQNIEDLTKKATQQVWSKILFDLKQEKGDEIILIPIANDKEIESLNSLTKKFNISESPVIIINEEIFVYNLNSVEGLKQYLN